MSALSKNAPSWAFFILARAGSWLLPSLPVSVSHRLLLRHTVQRAQAPDRLRAVDPHRFPIGGLPAQRGQRHAIVGVVRRLRLQSITRCTMGP